MLKNQGAGLTALCMGPGSTRAGRKPLLSILSALAFVVTGCSAAPSGPITPITNVAMIAGNWQGTTTSANGSVSPSTATINSDGTWVSNAFGQKFQGTYMLANGVAHWKSATTGATGTWTLRTVNGTLVLDEEGNNSHGEARRAS
jgi:hypothetical protein